MVPEHAGLIMCCDGVPVFKSSGMLTNMSLNVFVHFIYIVAQTLWPVLMYTISFPPAIRMNAENMMVCALWLGPCKPHMTILPPVLSKIDKLERDGLKFATQEGDRILKAKLVAGVFDLPAKAMALNIMQFNGYYGCPYCLDKGVHKHKRHLYYPDEPHRIRKQKDIKHWAQQAELTSHPVCGIKGFSVLRPYLPIRRIPVDYMHAMLEGITKAFLECWMNPNTKG